MKLDLMNKLLPGSNNECIKDSVICNVELYDFLKIKEKNQNI